MGNKELILILSGLVGSVQWSGIAQAHHSYAMFDRSVLQLSGTVKDYQWTNPHVWIIVLASANDGTTVEWGIETGSPNMLKSRGWKAKAMRPGDKITATIHPKRDGSKQGSLIQLTLGDGTVLKDRDLVLVPLGPGGTPSGTGAPP